MQKPSGTLFGIGVGPGDPELITMKAIRVLKRVDFVFAASSAKNSHSLAVDIARPYIPEGTPVERLRFPMTTDQIVTQKAWMENAARIYEAISGGSDAAFLTLGDPMTYSTYGYILRYLNRIDDRVVPVTVPGITSYQAAAARLNTPLAEGEEALLVLSGATGGNRLRELTVKPENIVFLKAYRNVPDIRRAIDEAEPGYRSTAISNCGHTAETIIEDLKDLESRSPDYWTLIIAKKKK